jgi:hypothetical protein
MSIKTALLVGLGLLVVSASGCRYPYYYDETTPSYYNTYNEPVTYNTNTAPSQGTTAVSSQTLSYNVDHYCPGYPSCTVCYPQYSTQVLDHYCTGYPSCAYCYPEYAQALDPYYTGTPAYRSNYTSTYYYTTPYVVPVYRRPVYRGSWGHRHPHRHGHGSRYYRTTTPVYKPCPGSSSSPSKKSGTRVRLKGVPIFNPLAPFAHLFKGLRKKKK